MKLLFDQNLSPNLPRLLSDLYVGSTTFVMLGFVTPTTQHMGICGATWLRHCFKGFGFSGA